VSGRRTILLLLGFMAVKVMAWGSYEDFTRASLWTETDTGSMLAIGPTGDAVSTTVKESPGARLVGNFGTDYFGDFEFRFTGDTESSLSTYATWRMGVSDLDGFWPDADAGDSVWLQIYCDGSYVHTISLISVDDGTPTGSGSSFTISTATTYYVTFKRTGTTLWLGFYSDSARTTHISGSPISMTCISTQLEYCHAWNAKGDVVRNIPWDVVNFDMDRAPAQTTLFYVDDVNGLDTYDGLYLDHSAGLDHGPFATIDYAVDFWRVGAGKTVYVRGGTYPETVTFSQGGSAGSPLTLARYQSETPILEGSYAIPKSAWTACADAGDALGNANWANMYYCTLPAGPNTSSNLYQGSDTLNLAQDCEPANRWNYYDQTNWHQRATGVTRTTITDANLPTYGGADLVGGYVGVRTTSNHVGMGQITNWDSGTNTITFADIGADPEQSGTKYIYVIYNSPADYQFDDAGEYVIGEDRYCVVWPWDATDLTTAADGTVTVSVRGWQMYLSSYDYIVVDGLTFRRGYAVAIYDNYADHCTIKNCTITECCNLNGPATNHVYMLGEATTFEGNTMSYGRGEMRGLVCSGDDSVWSGNTIDHYSGAAMFASGSDRCQIIDNTITNGTGPHTNAIAIQACADKVLIARNKIVDTPRLTVSVSENVIICHNVFDYATWDAYWLSDNGGCTGYLRCFNNTMLGPGTYYWVKNLASGWTTSVFTNNVIDSSNASPGTHTYNVFTSDNHWTLGTGESVNYSEASLIVNWAGEDYTPVESGDLHDTGTDVSSLFDTTRWPSFNFNLDLNGNLRTGTWDIGAIERGAGAPPTYYLLIRSGP